MHGKKWSKITENDGRLAASAAHGPASTIFAVDPSVTGGQHDCLPKPFSLVLVRSLVVQIKQCGLAPHANFMCHKVGIADLKAEAGPANLRLVHRVDRDFLLSGKGLWRLVFSSNHK